MLTHLAIIPDGNRRWARSRRKYLSYGHEKSLDYENLLAIFQEAKKRKIKYFSIWGFSTDNWKRTEKEKRILFKLIYDCLGKFHKDAEKNKIRFRHIGRRDRIPKYLLERMAYLEDRTQYHKDFNFQLCLDYGGRDELLRAISSYVKQWGPTNNLTEQKFSPFLDTYGIPDIDLIIRTSGEQRLSGFMPWQSTYAELYFLDIHFPDFRPKHLIDAVSVYNKRKRRFGE